MATQEDIIQGAADLARQAADGQSVSDSVTRILAAAAAQYSEQGRHAMAREAAARAGQLTDLALRVLEVAIFALA